MNHALKTGFDRWLFPAASPYPLAICRAVVFGWLFVWYYNFDFTAVAFYPEAIWRPIRLLTLFRLDHMPGEQVLAILQVAWKTSLLLAAFGLMSRSSTAVACFLGAYLLALTHSFHKINHSDGALILAMGVLMFARCGDVFSVDALLKQKLRRNGTHSVPPAASAEYGWPLQLVRLVLVLVFFGSGISKILLGGLPWMFSDNLYTYVLHAQIAREPPITIDLPHATFGLLFKIMAIGTVVIELASPLALWSRIASIILIPSLFLMQIGIRLLMGDNFTQFIILYVFWLPWARIAASCFPVAGTATSRAAQPPTMIARFGGQRHHEN